MNRRSRTTYGQWREEGAEGDEEQRVPTPLHPKISLIAVLAVTVERTCQSASCIAEPKFRLLHLGDSTNQQNIQTAAQAHTHTHTPQAPSAQRTDEPANPTQARTKTEARSPARTRTRRHTQTHQATQPTQQTQTHTHPATPTHQRTPKPQTRKPTKPKSSRKNKHARTHTHTHTRPHRHPHTQAKKQQQQKATRGTRTLCQETLLGG